MALTATWVNRNKVVQADVPVDHFAAGVTPPAGLQTVCKWSWKPDLGDAWGPPEIHIVDLPATTDSYDPPGSGWVRFESYTQLNGKGCWQPYDHMIRVDGSGDPYAPSGYVDQADDGYIDHDGNEYEG